MRIVAGDSFAEPNDFGDAEIGAKLFLGGGAIQAGIADLHFWVEQTFFGGEQRALTVGVDGAAFQDEIRFEDAAA